MSSTMVIHNLQNSFQFFVCDVQPLFSLNRIHTFASCKKDQICRLLKTRI